MFRKYFHFYIFILIILAFNSNVTFSQSCDDCGKRSLGVYDPHQMVPRPTGDDTTLARLLPRWWQLFRVGDGIRSYLHNQDASQSCITFIDIHIMHTEGSPSWNDSLVFGVEYANAAPAGPVKAFDYLIESTVSGTEGNYTLTASLQSAVTREVVASGSTSFTDMWNAVDAAKQLAAATFAPIFNKIRTWEEQKREEDPEVTIGAEIITITPEKTKIETGEQVNVKFEFKDCDDQPLKNKQLQLVEGTAFGIRLDGPTGGHFDPSYITTDDEGKATAAFIAGSQPGAGVLRAYFVYKYPSGHDGIAGGESVINIKQGPTDYYAFTASVTSTLTYNRDTSSSFSIPGASFERFFKDMMVRNGSANARGIIRNETPEPGQFFYDGNEPIIAGFVSGSVSEIEISNSGEFFNGQLVSGDIRTDATSGPAIPDLMGLQIYYDENSSDKAASFGVPCRRVGDYKGKWYDGPDWVDYDGKYDDSVANVSASWDDEKGTGSFTKVDSGFVINYTLSETYKENTLNGTASITENKSLVIHIRPFNYLTSVDGEDDEILLPERSKLYQNYPNPFNPVTNIDFYAAKEGTVTIKVYDVLGKEISTLVNDYKKAGFHTVKFNATNLTSGIYFYQLNVNGYTEQKKLVVLK